MRHNRLLSLLVSTVVLGVASAQQPVVVPTYPIPTPTPAQLRAPVVIPSAPVINPGYTLVPTPINTPTPGPFLVPTPVASNGAPVILAPTPLPAASNAPPANPAIAATNEKPTQAASPGFLDGPTDPMLPKAYVNLEYLLWCVRDSSVVPVVTSSTTGVPLLNVPGTNTLFGGDLDSGCLSGIRFGGGGWINDNFGGEINFFFLENKEKEAIFNSVGRGAGGPRLGTPFLDARTNLENVISPLTAAARSTINYDVQLWGMELVGLVNLRTDEQSKLHALVGYRLLALDDNFQQTNIAFAPNNGGSITTQDTFQARNRFNGLLLGVRGAQNWNAFTLEVTGKLSFGWTDQVVKIAANSAVTGNAFGLPNQQSSSGIFAQDSNSGRHRRCVFAVAPELQIKGAYNFSDSISAFVAYDVICISSVVRASNQIDRNANPSQNPVLSPILGPAGNVAAPTFGFRDTNFWAQGVSLGVQIRF